jgi:putative ABC transport system ATP-binding protein
MGYILQLQQENKIYTSGGKELSFLENINFSVEAGTTLAIVGPSGSGKTTLLGLCAGLDKPTNGKIWLHGQSIEQLSEDGLTAIRNKYVGFIFQNFQLMPRLTALENVMVPLELRGERHAKTNAMELLEKVGLANRHHHYPAQLSGGEQQRIAIARAFANKPALLFADEPTGNLDAETSEIIVHLIFDLNRAAGTTLVLVTHDVELAAKTLRIIRMKGGKIVQDSMAVSLNNHAQ